MNTNFRFATMTIFVFCLYLFWGSIGIETTLNPTKASIPLHRGLIVFTVFIFLFNYRKVLAAFLKNKLLITLILYTLLTAMWASNSLETVKNFIFILSVLFISIMTALAFSENKVALIRWLFWLYFLLTIASIATAILFPKIGIQSGQGGVTRWMGITQHANELGALELASIWLSSNLFFSSKSKFEKLIILSALSAAFFAILKADSMTSFITALVISSYVCYGYILGRLNLSSKLVLYTVAILGFITLVTFYRSTSELTSSTLASTGRNLTFTGRTFLWQTALKNASDNLFLGYGFDSLEQLSKKTHIGMSHLHSGYVELLVKGGVVACILTVILLIKTVFHQLRIKLSFKQDFIFLNSGLVMVLMHNVTESSLLRGLNPLNIFIIFIIVSTSLLPLKMKDNTLPD